MKYYNVRLTPWAVSLFLVGVLSAAAAIRNLVFKPGAAVKQFAIALSNARDNTMPPSLSQSREKNPAAAGIELFLSSDYVSSGSRSDSSGPHACVLGIGLTRPTYAKMPIPRVHPSRVNPKMG